jgi:hypothetical protein
MIREARAKVTPSAPPPAPQTVSEVLARAEVELDLAVADDMSDVDRVKRLVAACDGRPWPPTIYSALIEIEPPPADQQHLGTDNPRRAPVPPSVAAEVRGLVREAQRDRAEKSKVAEVRVEEQVGDPLQPDEYAAIFQSQ